MLVYCSLDERGTLTLSSQQMTTTAPCVWIEDWAATHLGEVKRHFIRGEELYFDLIKGEIVA